MGVVGSVSLKRVSAHCYRPDNGRWRRCGSEWVFASGGIVKDAQPSSEAGHGEQLGLKLILLGPELAFWAHDWLIARFRHRICRLGFHLSFHLVPCPDLSLRVRGVRGILRLLKIIHLAGFAALAYIICKIFS